MEKKREERTRNLRKERKDEVSIENMFKNTCDHCSYCGGKTFYEDISETECPRCKGKGRERSGTRDIMSGHTTYLYIICATCKGKGKILYHKRVPCPCVKK
jgi:Archaea-specific RecJ-like exonuclease, contains DnaJ-type Zn finger domain